MSKPYCPITLNNKLFLDGLAYLSKVDRDLAKVITDYGNPPMWSRKPGFPTLLLIILEQQVSLASARAAFNKLQQNNENVTPESFLEFSREQLKTFGFSRQKITYSRGLAQAILEGSLDLRKLSCLEDAAARHELMKIKGIGPWTADIYLLMALLRPDIWPIGDLALAKATQHIKNLPGKPDQEMLNQISVQWKPWRAVAARVVWHYYLSQ